MTETTEDNLGCSLCGTYQPCTACERCGAVVHLGMAPICWKGRPEDHGVPGGNNVQGGLGFRAYDEEHLVPEQKIHISSLAQHNRLMKETGWEMNSKYKHPRLRRTILKTVNGKLVRPEQP